MHAYWSNLKAAAKKNSISIAVSDAKKLKQMKKKNHEQNNGEREKTITAIAIQKKWLYKNCVSLLLSFIRM